MSDMFDNIIKQATCIARPEQVVGAMDKLEAEITRLRLLVAELKEDGERLNKALDCYPSDRIWDYTVSKDEFCEHRVSILPNEKNEAQEAHRSLMSKVDEVTGN